VIGQTPPAAQSVPPTFSGAWGDMDKDMAAIAAEMTPQPAQPAPNQPPAAATVVESKPVEAAQTQTPTPEPVAAQPQTPPAPAPEVPEKFRGTDGKLDQEKLLKSYFEAEKGLKRLQNAQTQQPNTPVAPQVAPQAPQQVQNVPTAPLTPFEAQVAQELIDIAAAAGQQMPQAYAIAQARVQVKLMEAKHKADTAATFGEVAQFREALAQQQSRTELMNLAEKNPWVLDPKGQAELIKIREEKPWINASPTPWADAVEVLLGRKTFQSQSAPGQVQMPTPQGSQQTAPPLPVTPVPVAAAPIRIDTPEQLQAHLKTLTPAQEAEYWKRQGLKWDTPPNKGFY